MSAATASPAAPVAGAGRSALDGLPMAQDLPKVLGGCPEPLSASIRHAVRAGGDWLQTAQRVAGILRHQLPSPTVLSQERLRGDLAGYQTHLLHAEPDGSFSVAVMVWLPGQQTPVHDHLSWCVTAVLRGTEYEEIFAPAADGSGLEVVARN